MANSNEMKLPLKAILDTSDAAIADLNRQIAQLSNRVGKLQVKVEVSPEVKTIQISGILEEFKKAFSDQGKEIAKVLPGTIELNTQAARLQEAYKRAATASTMFGVSLNGLKTALIGTRLAAAALEATVTMGLSVAITFVAGIISSLIENYEEQKRHQEELDRQNRQLAESWTNHKDSILELIDTYNQLNGATNNGSVFISLEQEEAYKDTVEQLSVLMPNLIESVDDKGNKHLKNANAIQDELERTEKLAEAQARMNIGEAKFDFNSQLKEIESLEKNLKGLEKKKNKTAADHNQLIAMADDGVKGELREQSAGVLAEIDRDMINKKSEIEAAVDSLRSKFALLTKDYLAVNDIQINDQTAKALQDIAKGLDFSNMDGEKLKATSKQLAELVELMKQPTLSDEETKRYDELIEVMNLAEYKVNGLKRALKSDDNKNNGANQTLKETSTNIQSLVSAYDQLQKGESLSNATVHELIKSHPKLAEYIKQTNDLTFKKGEILEQVANAEREQRLEEQKNQLKSLEDTYEYLESKRNMYVDYYNKLNTTTVWSSFLLTKPPEWTEEDQKAFEEYEKKKKELEATIAIDSKPIEFKLPGSGSGKSSPSSAPFQSSLNYNKNQDAIDKLNRALQANREQIDLAVAAGRPYEEMLEQRVKLYNQLTVALNQDKSSLEQEQSNLQKRLAAWGLVDGQGNVVGDVDAKLNQMGKKGGKAYGSSMEEIQKDVARYIALPGEISSLNSQIVQSIQGLADTLASGLEKIKAESEQKRSRWQHNISLLGEINTEAEKVELRNYSEQILRELVHSQGMIKQEFDRAKAMVENKDKQYSPVEMKAAQIYLQSVIKEQQSNNEEIVSVAQELGKLQAEAVIFGFDKQLEEKKHELSLLGNLDTEEEKAKAKAINDEIADILLRGEETFQSELTRLRQEAARQTDLAEQHRIQSQIETMETSQKSYQLQLVQSASEEKKIRSEAADKIIEAYKKMYEQQRDWALQAVEEQLKAENRRHDERMKHLDAEQKQYEDIINAQLKALNRQSDEEDYQTHLNKLIRERDQIANKINVLSADNSIEGKARKAELQKQLDEKNEEIEKFKKDREKSLRIEGLQDELEKHRNIVGKEKDLENDKHQSIVDNLNAQKEEIDKLYRNRIENEQKFAKIRETMLNNDKLATQNMLLEVQGDYNRFFEEITRNAEKMGENVTTNLRSLLENALNGANGRSPSVSRDPSGPSGPSERPSDSGSGGTGKTPNQGNNGTKSQMQSDWEQYLNNKKQAEKLYDELAGSVSKSRETEIRKQIETLRMKNDEYRRKYPGLFPDKSYGELVSQKPPFSAETGGMTPEFRGGKFLLAHEKEIILNKSDTANFLKVVDLTRNLVHSIKSFDPAKLLAGLANPAIAAAPANKIDIHIGSIAGDRKGGEQALQAIVKGLKAKGVHL
ncbi:hypothetical protein PAE9249_05138 [Paenibacillus sp. CECT 9249]|uniref:hypothetical protein n=1 Tax=Paenibacillus sp. CECT 9249 TaxID=2845385 RepID=UPI001E62F8C1|nr:hypothetical protein [Paenibacillus sp. CECT 9249]CAH0122566.1 hypothetical protein PAE9249_05138 [Paenibacillus sp. CECT 9249]